MKLFIATDVTIYQSNDKIYAKEKHATIFRRYHDSFGKIVLCSRVQHVNGLSKDFVDISNEIEEIVIINSLSKMLLGKYKSEMMREIQRCNLVIARCPSLAAYRSAEYARILKKPYFAESMGCAWDAYWNHGIAGKLIAPYMFFKMKHVVADADYALYVTEKFLQNRYPCNNGCISASNVLIKPLDEKILDLRLSNIKEGNLYEVSLMTTAAVDVRYKGQEYVIRAIPKLNRLGIRVKYNVVGEGSSEYLERVAEDCGVTDQIHFTGAIPLNEVFDLLDSTDIYIQPSLQEGLPRSVIEAMSRGCACIGARTAGIPELLEDDYVVRRRNVNDIVSVIQKYCNMSYEERTKIAERNFREAQKYTEDVLNKRRNDYYSQIASEIYESSIKR